MNGGDAIKMLEDTDSVHVVRGMGLFMVGIFMRSKRRLPLLNSIMSKIHEDNYVLMWFNYLATNEV